MAGGREGRLNVVRPPLSLGRRLESKANLPYTAYNYEEVMSTLTITAKGQVTLRKDVLEHLGVHPGEKITVDKLPHGRVELRAVRRAGKISDVFNRFKREDGPSLSIEEISEAIRRGWAGER
jgi:hypothetical protein